jgi:hypothetical protein
MVILATVLDIHSELNTHHDIQLDALGDEPRNDDEECKPVCMRSVHVVVLLHVLCCASSSVLRSVFCDS